MTPGAVVRLMVSDHAINRERRELCLRRKRFLHSRRRSRALTRAFRRAGPSTQSKHVLKPCSEFDSVDDIHRFLEENGLSIAVHVFFKSRLCARESGVLPYEHM